jgi:hypothetical protein
VTHQSGGPGIPSLPVIPVPGLDEQLIDLASWLPHGLPLGDLVSQPLALSYTCGPKGPAWVLKNTSSKAYGFAWIDLNHGFGFSESPLPAGKSIPLNSSAGAVIAGAFDAKSADVVLAVPAFAIATCTATTSPTSTSTKAAAAGAGTAGKGTAVAGASATTTAVKPTTVAAPATAVVTDKVHYTG